MNKITDTMSDATITATLYDRLEEHRKNRELSQLDMAERLGITPKSYRAIQNGKCKLITFIALLRQLSLIDRLDNVVPEQNFSPLKVAKKSRAKVNSVTLVRKKLKIK
jgi:transcriptional regulator with XRE-family HTH domain